MQPNHTFHQRQAMALLCLMFLPGLALAQSMDQVTVDSLQQAGLRSGDTVISWLGSFLGDDFVRAPLAAVGQPSTVLQRILFYFNAALFALVAAGGVWVVLASIVNSATDGEPSVGKAAGGAWLPIRAGVAIFSLVPVWSGFNLAQSAVSQDAVLGGGLANIAVDVVLETQKEGIVALTPSYPSPLASPNLSSELRAATENMFLAELCSQAWNGYQRKLDPAAALETVQVSQLDQGVKYDFGRCGVMILHQRSGASTRDNSTLTGDFRNASVNYEGIAKAVQASAAKQLQTIRTDTLALAQHWGEAITSSDFTGDYSALASDAVAGIASTAAKAKQDLNTNTVAAIDGKMDGIKQETVDRIRAAGWAGFGQSYSVLAEVSASVADAQKAYTFDFTPGPYLQALLDKNAAPVALPATFKQAMEAYLILARGEDKDAIAQVTADAGNATGATSLGQTIVKWVTETLFANSGGAGLVNPIIASKNLGDWLMSLGQAGLAASTLASLPITPTGIGLKAIKAAVGSSNGVLNLIWYAMIAGGAYLSTFLPMLPFIIWFGAVVRYVRQVIEAMVSVSVGAFQHLQLHGQGLAPGAAARMYDVLMDVLLRPVLMVIAFLIASAGMVFAGSWLMQIFFGAMNFAQGNSVTGLLSIMCYLGMFAFLMTTTVSLSFSIVQTMPDQLLSAFGLPSDRDPGVNTTGLAEKVKGAAGGGAQQVTGGVAGVATKALTKV